MQIGGLQKTSMIDFPGRISCVIFLSGCNFDCPFCHNPELVREPPGRVCPHTPESILGFLADRRNFLDGVVISGGEPTLQSDLAALCRKIKAMGFSVKLDTNGSRPRVVQALLEENLIDYVAMDLKTDPTHYPAFFRNGVRLEALLASIRLIMESGVDYEFRTTCVKPWVTPETVRGICGLIHGARRYILQRFRPEGVLQPEYFARRSGRLSPAEMHALKSLAAPCVQECSIRQ
jgi:pyruvate formate lyase activating enzyme